MLTASVQNIELNDQIKQQCTDDMHIDSVNFLQALWKTHIADTLNTFVNIVDNRTIIQDLNFQMLNVLLNSACTIISIYFEVCKILNFDFTILIADLIKLESWQIIVIHWMLLQEKRDIKKDILIDKLSLDKTMTSLQLVSFSFKFHEELYYSMLIVISSELIDIWLFEFHVNFFNIMTLLFFYDIVDADETFNLKWKKYWINQQTLVKTVWKLDLNNFITERVIIFMIYSMWMHCITSHQLKCMSNLKWETEKKMISVMNTIDNNLELTLTSETDINSLINSKTKLILSWVLKTFKDSKEKDFKNIIKNIKFFWSENLCFWRIIFDEAHIIKNMCFWNNKMICQLFTQIHWAVTATSLANRLYDILRFLHLIYHDEFEKSAFDYSENLDFFEVYQKTSLNSSDLLYILNSWLCNYLFFENMMNNQILLITLFCILNRIMMRQTMRFKMILSDDLNETTVSADISLYVIKTVNCSMTLLQMIKYVNIHKTLIRNLCAVSSVKQQFVTENTKSADVTDFDEKTVRRMNIKVYCWLRHAAFSLELKHLYHAMKMKRERNLVKDVIKWRSKSEEDLIWLILWMCQDSVTLFISEDHEWFTDYLINLTLKFFTLLKIVQQMIIKEKKRLLVFADFLMSQYKTKSYLRILSFNVVTLCVSMSTQKHSQIATFFNNFISALQILMIIY